MSKRINPEAFPEGVFDFAPLGHNLTRESVVEQTKEWTPGHYEAFEKNGYGAYLISDEPKSKSNTTTPEDKPSEKK